MDGLWQPGDPILLREVYDRRVWALRPVRIVRDSGTSVVTYLAPGTIWKRPVSTDGSLLRLQCDEWRLADTEWHGNAALRLFSPGSRHSVIVHWDALSGAFRGWYVNLETPMRRTSIGFDYLDRALDIVIEPDRSWRWKDEDEFAAAQVQGLIGGPEAELLRAEGERVIEALEANRPPFSDGWEQWRPSAKWTPATVPAGWSTVSIADDVATP